MKRCSHRSTWPAKRSGLGPTTTATTDRIRVSGKSRQPSSWQRRGWKCARHKPGNQPADSRGNGKRNGSQVTRHEYPAPSRLLCALPICFPGPHKHRDAFVRPVKAQGHQIRMHLLGGAPFFARFALFRHQPAGQLFCKRIQLAPLSHMQACAAGQRAAAVPGNWAPLSHPADMS